MALTQEQINQAYQAALGRGADAGSAQFYVDYNTLLNTLAASQEAQSRAQAAIWVIPE